MLYTVNRNISLFYESHKASIQNPSREKLNNFSKYLNMERSEKSKTSEVRDYADLKQTNQNYFNKDWVS